MQNELPAVITTWSTSVRPGTGLLKADELRRLSLRSNAPASLRALTHLGAIAASIYLLDQVQGSWLVVPATLLTGYLLAFLFCMLHETTHLTAFRTRVINQVCSHVAGFVLLLPAGWYRVFHWDHHRYTQDPARDPELATPLPASLVGLLWLCTGVPTMINRIRMLVRHGLLRKVNAPWVKPTDRVSIANEAGLHLALHALVFTASVATGSTAVYLYGYLPMMLGHLFLRPYLLAEHTGCDHSSNMLANTRTIHTNAVLRWFAWDMPFHVEHHAYPSVPFHTLNRLHAVLAGHTKHIAAGYVAATGKVIGHLQKAPDRAKS